MVVAGGQCPRPNVCCSQTLVSRDSSKNSSSALDAGAEFSEVSEVPEVQESPVVEPPKGERVETTAVVQGAMAETWEYAEENYVFAFGDEVSVDVQRRETHI